MIEFKSCNNILTTHHENGAINGTHRFVKDKELYLLDGYESTLKGTKQLKHGWYDKDILFVSKATEEEVSEMTSMLPF